MDDTTYLFKFMECLSTCFIEYFSVVDDKQIESVLIRARLCSFFLLFYLIINLVIVNSFKSFCLCFLSDCFNH